METKVVNKRKEEFDVYIGRGSPYGNPFTHIKDKETKAEFIVASREESIAKFREYFYRKLAENVIFRRAVESLKGKTLGCFCKPQDCHGDVIREYLDNDFKILFRYNHLIVRDGVGEPERMVEEWMTPEDYAQTLNVIKSCKESIDALIESSRQQLESAGFPGRSIQKELK